MDLLACTCSDQVGGFEQKSFIIKEFDDMSLRLEGYEEGDTPCWYEDEPMVEIWKNPFHIDADIAIQASVNDMLLK